MTIMKAFLVMLLSVLLEYLGQIPIVIFNLFFIQFTNVSPYINFAMGVLIKYFVIIFLLKCYSVGSYQVIHKQRINIKKIICVTLLIIGFRIIFDNSLIYLVNKIPVPNFINEAFNKLSISPIILILSVAVIAPIYEEVIFRGILLKAMASKINPKLALVVSALFFAMAHMNIPQGINAFLLGLLIGGIYLNTDSIYLCIFAHFVNNSLGILISEAFQLISGENAILIHCISFIIGIIILTIAYGILRQNKKRTVSGIYKEFTEL